MPTLLITTLLVGALSQSAFAQSSGISDLRVLDEALGERSHQARDHLRRSLAAPGGEGLRATLACVSASVEDYSLQSATHANLGTLAARGDALEASASLDLIRRSEGWVRRALRAFEACAETLPSAALVVRADEARLQRRAAELRRLSAHLVELLAWSEGRSNADAQTLRAELQVILAEHHAVWICEDSTGETQTVDEFGWDDADRYYAALGTPTSQAEWPARSSVPYMATAVVTGGLLAWSLLGSLGTFGSRDSVELPLGISTTWGLTLSAAAAIIPALSWQRPSWPTLVIGATLSLSTAVGGAFAIARGDRNKRYFGGGLLGGSAIGLGWLAGGIAHWVFEHRHNRAWERFLEARIQIQPAIATGSVGLQVSGVF